MAAEKYTREELAGIEVGQTTISLQGARVLTALFLMLIFLVPLVQELAGVTNKKDSGISVFLDQFGGLGQQLDEPAFVERVEDINTRLLQAIDLTEDELEEKTVLHTPFQLLQRSLLMLGKGNEKVLPGREQWLFYSKDVEHLISSSDVEAPPYSVNNPKNDPVKAIVDFRDKLRQRGAELVLLPTPLKPMIHPEKLSPMSTVLSETVYYDGWRDLKQRLEKKTVHFFDPSPVLKQFVLDRGKDAYLKADTHWTPAAMEVVAQHLAEYLHTDLGLEVGSVKYKKEPEVIENQGDIADMLKLSADKGYQKESVKIYPVFTEGGELWRQSSTANVLLLGDSFSNIYSLESMGWGRGAGFGEQLSYYLRMPIDTITQNDEGAYVTREKLAVDLARGINRLESAQVVIWQFAFREFNQGVWKIIALPEGKQDTSGEFYLVPEGEVLQVQAEIRDLSKSPRPGSVPYKDNIITLHLVNVKDVDSGALLGECLVYAWGMIDNELTPLATAKIGDQVTLSLRDFVEVETELSGIRRSVLDDEMIEYEMPNWGEITE